MIKVGLVCYDTQKKQLENMLQNDNLKVIDLNYSGKNKLKKLLFIIKRILAVDIVYFGYGCYSLNKYLKIANFFNKKVICHWIGTDVLRAKESTNLKDIQKLISYNLAGSPLLKSELNELGIDAEEIAILPNSMNENYSKLPQDHGVVAYLPEGREEFYGIEHIKYAARNYNELKFYVVGNGNDKLNLPNVKFLGKISQDEMNNLYDKTTILIRLPEHDGLSLMLLEALIKGKEVLYCYNFPHTRHIKDHSDLDEALTEILSKKPYYNQNGHNYILDNYNIDLVKDKLYNTLKKVYEKRK